MKKLTAKNFVVFLAIAVLVSVYLYAFSKPGLWHDGAFLYLQEDGSYKGSNRYADFSMQIQRSDGLSDISFSVNGEQKSYTVKTEDLIGNGGLHSVEISEGSDVLFRGQSTKMGDEYFLTDENGEPYFGEFKVIVGGEAPEISEMYPSRLDLFRFAVFPENQRRGNSSMLVAIIFMVIALVFDIIFPNFAFYLKHGLATDFSEPSDWYRFMQKVGRVIIAVAILVCMVATFTVK